MDLSVQDNTGRSLLSLSVWAERQPGSCSLLAREICSHSTLVSGEDLLRNILRSREYHIAGLLLHYGLDLMLEDVDMRTEWTETLTAIGRLPNTPCDTLVSEETRRRKLSHNTKDQTHLAGQTLLSLAALFRQEKAFQVLLDWGIDPTCPAIAEIQSKWSIVSQTNESMSQPEPLAHKRESDDCRMSDELRQGPLAWAAYIGNVPLVQSILDQGMNPNIQNRKGQTALYFAVQQTQDKYSRIDLETDKEEIVRRLLKMGAMIPTDAYDGATILHHAFKAGYGKLVKLLLDHGAAKSKGAINGSVETLWDVFDKGQEGIRQALLERLRVTQLNSGYLQSSSSDVLRSGDPLGIAVRLIWRGTMRTLGDAVPSASDDGEFST